MLLSTHDWNWGDIVFFDPGLNANHGGECPSTCRCLATIKQNAASVAQLPTWNLGQPGGDMALQDAGAKPGHTTIVVQEGWQSAKDYPSELPAADVTLARSTDYEVEALESSSGHQSSDTRTGQGEGNAEMACIRGMAEKTSQKHPSRVFPEIAVEGRHAASLNPLEIWSSGH